MFTNDPATLGAEVAYRRSRSRQSYAAGRGGLSRAGWVRRIAAAQRGEIGADVGAAHASDTAGLIE